MEPGMFAYRGLSIVVFTSIDVMSVVDAPASSYEVSKRADAISKNWHDLGRMLVSFFDNRSPSYIYFRLRRKLVSK